MDAESLMTPMLRQYFDLKKEADGAILFFRMGDFYEIFGTDAEEIAPKLEIVLTAREKGDQTKIPFCGVPHHAATGYWLKLVRLGYKVSIVEQLESPAPGKGLVKRGIVRTYTPGSVDELEGLDRDAPAYLMAHMEVSSKSVDVVAICDISTGELRVGNISSEEFLPLVKQVRPKEILSRRFAIEEIRGMLAANLSDENIKIDVLPEAPLKDEVQQAAILKETFAVLALDDQPCGKVQGGAALVVAVLAYIRGLQASTAQFTRVQPLRDPGTMILSDTVIRDLEIFETSKRRQSEGSLAHTIDHTLSPMGARCLRYALSHPFSIAGPITIRHEAVSKLNSGEHDFLNAIRLELKGVGDIARLATRIVSGSVSPLELNMVRVTLEKAARLSNVLALADCKKSALEGLSELLASGEAVRKILCNALVDHPSLLGSGRGVFRKGFDSLLDEKALLATSGEDRVAAYEEALRVETGIGSLKIKDHKTFGLLIEVTKSNFSKIPASFIRRQTMVNCERFATMELKDLNEALLTACDLAIAREAELYGLLIESLKPFLCNISNVSRALGELDLLQSFAWIAKKEGWCRPTLQIAGRRRLMVRAGRHPVVERIIGKHLFCANDVLMTSDKSHLLITGPNMAGKSTVMRQTALLAIMCQAGSYVPANSAEMPIFDRIFTRVGAADDLSRGQSTFMVEMIEAAEILRQATDRSLVILDEVGRGTSSSDGLAIAAAILEELVDRVNCFSLFATHYHELVGMMASRTGIKSVQTEVIEKDNLEIIFTHRLVEGASGNSFGIEVARLAGIPGPVLAKARSYLGASEVNLAGQPAGQQIDAPKNAAEQNPVAGNLTRVQRDLFGLEGSPSNPAKGEKSQTFNEIPGRFGHLDQIVLRLENLKIHRTTPMQALNILDELKRMLVPSSQKSLFEGDPQLTL
ncbi:MAG: DNA mismatch repair protein MutS [Proteobacteria bacterium]|nr:DNA mismatch repair protein MutS [Pseudomonadota bacterium]